MAIGGSKAPVKPMLATLVREPFDDPNWIFEVKYDGFRAIAQTYNVLRITYNERVKLYSRNNLVFKQFGAINKALAKLKHSVILDGEVVVLDKKGVSRFQLLQNYQKTGKGALVYFVFDILKLDGKDLHELPLIERKKILKALIAELHRGDKGAGKIADKSGAKGVVRYSEHIDAKGKAFFAAAKKHDLEGIMAKEKDSAYYFGRRTKHWLKIKTHMRQEAVIGGFTEPRGSRKGLGALILGVYEGGGRANSKNAKLAYIGHTGGGFDDRTLSDIYRLLKPIERQNSPFKDKFKVNAPVHWVEPKYVAEISFQEWTTDGHMRQPIFEGLRPDKAPKEVKREQAK